MYTLKVTNFQSIIDIELKIRGLTVVTAPSHSGKSALVRAVDSLFTSNWFQEAYQRKGTTQTVVSLTSGVGEQLTFTRKGSATTYSINGVSFGKLNGKVPIELAQAGYGEVQIAESASDITSILPQIQNQFDGPYQDVIKPAALTQLLGSFTNLAPYQTAQDKAKKQQAESRRESERVKKDIGKLSTVVTTFNSYDPVPSQDQLELLLKTIEFTNLTVLNSREVHAYLRVGQTLRFIKHTPKPWTSVQLQSVGAIVSSVSGTSGTIQTHRNNLVFLTGVKDVKSTLQKSLPRNFLVSNHLLKEFNTARSPLTYFIGTLKLYSNLTSVAQTIEKPTLIQDILVLTKAITQLGTKIIDQNNELTLLLEKMDSLAESKEDAINNLQTLEHNRHALDQALVNDQCPLCFNKLSGDSKKKPSKKKLSEVLP